MERGKNLVLNALVVCQGPIVCPWMLFCDCSVGRSVYNHVGWRWHGSSSAGQTVGQLFNWRGDRFSMILVGMFDHIR